MTTNTKSEKRIDELLIYAKECLNKASANLENTKVENIKVEVEIPNMVGSKSKRFIDRIRNYG